MNKTTAKNSGSVYVTMMYKMLCKHSRTFRDCTLLFQLAKKYHIQKQTLSCMSHQNSNRKHTFSQKQMDNTPSLLHPLPNPLSSLLPPPSLRFPILPRGWFCGTDAGITTALKWKDLSCSVRPEKRMKRQPCIIRALKINESLSAGEAGKMFCSLK